MRVRILLLAVIPVLLLIGACAPGAAVITPPSFELLPEGSGLTRIDPPGVGDGAAVFRLEMRVHNDNPVGLRLAELDGAMFLAGVRAADARFQGGVDLPARGSARLSLDVRVPLGQVPSLLPVVASLVGGAPTEVRVEAGVGVDVFGSLQRFPRFTLVRAEVRSPLALLAPSLTLDPGATELRLASLSSVEVRLAADLANPSPIGYRVAAPSLELSLAGVRVADAGLDAVSVPAGATVPVVVSFRFDPLSIAAALAGRLQGVAAGVSSVDFDLRGAWQLDAPGITSRTLAADSLLRGNLH